MIRIIITLSILFIGTTQIAFVQPIPQQSSKRDCRKDNDGDGISDCFDKCPDTPANVRVDAKGCPRDTDGDGIADYKDKELITPTECQPADSNGIGDCNRGKK
jgi:Thrombospondin type 3 repeat.